VTGCVTSGCATKLAILYGKNNRQGGEKEGKIFYQEFNTPAAE